MRVSRAAAEVITLLTGSPFFPGGLREDVFARGASLHFEYGPTADVRLQAATYYDAADQAGFSRLAGGIHPSYDDLPGRRLGARVGLEAFLAATRGSEGEAANAPGLVNVSVRATSGSGDEVLVAGFVVAGGESQDVLVRAVGPALEAYGIPRDLCAPDPSLAVYPAGATTPTVVNTAWGESPRRAAVAARTVTAGAFPLPEGGRDAAELVTTPGGAFTVVAPSGASTGRPVQLVEVYGRRLANVSARGRVEGGVGVLIAGFVVTGDEPVPVLIRGVGPGLAAFGVAGTAADPVIEVRRLDGEAPGLVARNDNWSDDERASLATVGAERVGAFPLLPGGRDAALFLQLPAGAYTVTLADASGAGGVGLAEVYHLR